MKRGNTYPVCLMLLLALTGLFSCGEDRWEEYYPKTGRDLWIDSIMREDYLWWEEMPGFNSLNYFQTPADFLNDVKAEADDYSSVDTLRATPDAGYGFDYSLSRVPDNDTAYYALVTYVVPQSPAEEAGLQRGDWIMQVDDDYITLKREEVLTEGGERNLVMGTYVVHPATDDSETQTTEVVEAGSVILPSARPVDDVAVPVSTILNGHIGYMVYNSFSPDTDADVLSFSRYCSENGVDELVLDLRYNEGGDMLTAQRWATILAPSSQAGSVFASLRYSAKQAARDRELTFDNSLLEGGGTNLNLSRIYILTSGQTSGAAEMLINGLQPYMEVVLIGAATDGNTYGMATYTDSRFAYALHLVVCEVNNALGTADYAGGFTPDHNVDELADPQTVLPLGHPDEALLSVALQLIDGTRLTTRAETATEYCPVRNVKARRYLPKGLSLDRIID